MKSNLDDFSHAWRKRINTWKVEVAGHTEKSAAQQLWSDLFRCFGIIPERIDLFERDAVRATTGNTGYIDLFWSGIVLGEAKSLSIRRCEGHPIVWLGASDIACGGRQPS